MGEIQFYSLSMINVVIDCANFKSSCKYYISFMHVCIHSKSLVLNVNDNGSATIKIQSTNEIILLHYKGSNYTKLKIFCSK